MTWLYIAMLLLVLALAYTPWPEPKVSGRSETSRTQRRGIPPRLLSENNEVDRATLPNAAKPSRDDASQDARKDALLTNSVNLVFGESPKSYRLEVTVGLKKGENFYVENITLVIFPPPANEWDMSGDSRYLEPGRIAEVQSRVQELSTSTPGVYSFVGQVELRGTPMENYKVSASGIVESNLLRLSFPASIPISQANNQFYMEIPKVF